MHVFTSETKIHLASKSNHLRGRMRRFLMQWMTFDSTTPKFSSMCALSATPKHSRMVACITRALCSRGILRKSVGIPKFSHSKCEKQGDMDYAGLRTLVALDNLSRLATKHHDRSLPLPLLGPSLNVLRRWTNCT